MDAEDEPLEQWYAEREGRRRAPGTRDAITLAPGPRRGSHVFRDVPRLVVEWDGFEWQPVAVAESYAHAYPLIVRSGPPDASPAPVTGDAAPAGDAAAGPRPPGATFPQADTPVALFRKGTGRHRRPDR
ncbi:DUF6087 family protein [Kitasatospora sp. NPDC059327]|uniref:DUF6087 family protein n=1 Tax=Kitasatospora sp. NPDC059327 TaxID=3346803 RepID=UPI00369A898B